MPAAAKEEMLASPNAEEIFSLAAGVAAALERREGANAARGEKSHQGIFSKNRRPHVSATWGMGSGTHQDRSLAWSETVLGPTIYLYDGDNDIEEMDQSGNVLARYVRGNHVDEPFAELRSATISYYEENGSDAITSLTTSAGALANTYAYDSFGKLTASNGVIVNPFQYVTREFDQETNIYYYRARYYDPSLGRFISEDPIGFGGGTHFYKYAANNPVLFDDPFGLWKNTGKPAASDINTIVCNGSGGIAVQIPTDQDLSCGIGNCIWRHENQHRREALASNPGVCRNVERGRIHLLR
jgi:RHS repeat-associated protein